MCQRRSRRYYQHTENSQKIDLSVLPTEWANQVVVLHTTQNATYKNEVTFLSNHDVFEQTCWTLQEAYVFG